MALTNISRCRLIVKERSGESWCSSHASREGNASSAVGSCMKKVTRFNVQIEFKNVKLLRKLPGKPSVTRPGKLFVSTVKWANAKNCRSSRCMLHVAISRLISDQYRLQPGQQASDQH